MQIIIDKLGFNVGTTMRNGRCMLICDTEGGECFSYLEWATKVLAIWVEAYSLHPVILRVSTGKELQAMILSRPQFIMTYGLDEELGLEPSREDAMRWIEESGGFDRDEEGNWSSPAEAFFPPVRIPLENALNCVRKRAASNSLRKA
jgi:hypothetical protein